MKKDCSNCFYSGRPLYKYPCCNCVSSCVRPPDKWEAKPMTNADRIRAMSDEKLAQTISRSVTTGACNDLGIPSKEQCDGNCKECVLEWLKQPWRAENEKPL